MINYNDPQASDKVRETLRNLDKQKKLPAFAKRVGNHGGVNELRVIMNSIGVFHLMERGMIGMFL